MQPLSISQYGKATQARIIATLDAAMSLDTRYPDGLLADLQTIRAQVQWLQAPHSDESECGMTGCGHSFDDHSILNAGCGCDICYPASVSADYPA